MKIGILTQPLIHNYGGLLQAYALKEVLQSLGHETIIINRRRGKSSWFRKKASILKSKLIGRKINPRQLLNTHQEVIISKEILSFQKKYIPELSELITNNKKMLSLNNKGFDAFVVGSDQCWRPIYSPSIRNYFLDFANEQKGIKRISYAASFGVSEWEFNTKDTVICKYLIQKFDAISVREKSGIDLVSIHLERNDAIHVVDPTMLLATEKYENIIEEEKIGLSPGDLKAYILDKNNEKDKLVSLIATKLRCTPFEILPKKKLGSEEVTNENVSDFAYPNPARWLRGFKDAKFVVTDSFHGTVFSILYNKPFITIGNVSRGMTRFHSLLNIFGLNNRLISDSSNEEEIDNIIASEIDWNKINDILEKNRDKAFRFLKKHLN